MTQAQTLSAARSPSGQPSSRPRRQWRRRVLFGLLLLVVATHPWWLEGIGEFLVAEEPVSFADAVLVLGGDHRLQRAADLVADETVSEVWLIERKPSYAVRAKILPAVHDVAVEQLVSLGVPVTQIRILSGQAREYEDAARVVAVELSKRHEVKVLILCHRLHGRNVRRVFSEFLSDTQFLHLSLLGLPAEEFDEHNWWRSRTGWKETFTALSDLAFTLVVGVERRRGPGSWDPDEYERQLISQFGEAACHAE